MSVVKQIPRHFLSIRDITREELLRLVERSAEIKTAYKANYAARKPVALSGLEGQNVAMLFSKRSTRTRISVESATTCLGGNSLFLGKDDIQLGVNECMYDTARVISSMTSGIVARVNSYNDVATLAKHSSTPVINGLCDTFHPLQALADLLTIKETFGTFDNLKVAWVGDVNNVLHDMLIACAKLGIGAAVAKPKDVSIRTDILALIKEAAKEKNTKIEFKDDPKEAVKNADIVVTDTWVSMGQEAEKEQRLKQFAGYQVTEQIMELANKSGKFMHCMPRHPEEVTDEVFYGPRSLVFQEAENRKWTTIAALEAFFVNRGNIL
ncbi:ornithine carbamoyltransferase Arg3 [Schizosaccharomyces japonicus yFS275]|uniref:ornithine carbamoyltransferase n=1 Tax=Schizosaccharomyces japonicus (strain yFS275 / FY16936) TaxID=402676 RepID=B6JW65_SCHJY|nr:ornithine carbamoyltransferase Arg3 [Schizosaccharomyces japonicus yFS275]EEB05616.1 ornithine carbamoyltransferase Arg3 [Schizosaccharomyces japonicus yFS275]